MWGGANDAKVDPTTEMYFLFSDPFIQESSNTGNLFLKEINGFMLNVTD